MPSTRAEEPTARSIGASRAWAVNAALRPKRHWTRHGGGPSRYGVYAVCRLRGDPPRLWERRFKILRWEWKRWVGEKYLAHFGAHVPVRTRERKFCVAFVEEYVKRAMASNGEKLRNVRKAAASAAVAQAGYRERVPRKKGTELLGLPRIQSEVQRVFAAQGVTLELSGQVLAEIMLHPLDDTVAASDKLNAVNVFLKATSGFAVQKQAHLHERAKRDKFFDEETFTAPAAPILTIDAEDL